MRIFSLTGWTLIRVHFQPIKYQKTKTAVSGLLSINAYTHACKEKLCAGINIEKIEKKYSDYKINFSILYTNNCMTELKYAT